MKNNDPVFCLENLERFEPAASLNVVMDSEDQNPKTTLLAYMRSTRNAVSKGYGTWVRYDDVLGLMVRVKSNTRKENVDG